MTPDDVLLLLAAHGGVAHSSAVRNAGGSDATVRNLVAAGELVRVRRSWLVTASCEPYLIAAASVGGRLTCVSAARRHGLWTPAADDVPHVIVPRSRSHADSQGIKLHWATGPIVVAPNDPSEPMLNVLFHVARCLSPDHALAVWESAVRMQRVSAEMLARTVWHSTVAARLAECFSGDSDSGLETRFVLLMRQIGVAVLQQVTIDGHRVDALIGDRLIVQLDGFAHHSSARERRRDIRADARLALLGYTVLRFDYHQLMREPHYVQEMVRSAMAQGLHLAR